MGFYNSFEIVEESTDSLSAELASRIAQIIKEKIVIHSIIAPESVPMRRT